MVQYYARQPQVQERLTLQIARELKNILGSANLAVVIDAAPWSISATPNRGAEHSLATAQYDGRFIHEETRKEFLFFIDK